MSSLALTMLREVGDVLRVTPPLTPLPPLTPDECPVCYATSDLVGLKVCTHHVCGVCLPRLEWRVCPVCRTRLEDYSEEKERRRKEDIHHEAVTELLSREARGAVDADRLVLTLVTPVGLLILTLVRTA